MAGALKFGESSRAPSWKFRSECTEIGLNFKLFIANAKPEVNSFGFFCALVDELSSERWACDRIVLLRSRMKALGTVFFLFSEEKKTGRSLMRSAF